MAALKTVSQLLEENDLLLAPMAGVTDRVFRVLCKEQGCGLTYTEMVSAKGLHYGGSAGKSRALLTTDERERPCAVQLFGSDPAIMAEQAARLFEESGDALALIDINMGCPAPKITGNGEGSALMKNPALAARVIRAVADAVPLPVTVKFRKGWDDESVNVVEFAKMAEQSGAAAVTVHGRTRMQFYSGTADWDCIARVKRAVSIPVIGNGDVFSPKAYFAIREKTGCDGVMIARGAQGNPWIFREIAAAKEGKTAPAPTAQERMETALRHARGLVAQKGEHAVVEMRKHVAWYIKGTPGAAALRGAVNECTTLSQLEALLLAYGDANAAGTPARP